MGRFLFSTLLLVVCSGLFAQISKTDTTIILKHIENGDSLLAQGDYEAANVEYRIASKKINNLSLYYRANPSEDLQVFLLNDSTITQKINLTDSLIILFVTDTMRYQRCIDRARIYAENNDFKLAVFEYRMAHSHLPSDSIAKKEMYALATRIRYDTIRITQLFQIQSLYTFSGKPLDLKNTSDTLFTLLDSSYFEGSIVQQILPTQNTFRPGDSLTILVLDYKFGILQRQSNYTCKLKQGFKIDPLSVASLDKLPTSFTNKDPYWNCVLANRTTRDESGNQTIYTTYYESGELHTMIIEKPFSLNLYKTTSIEFSESGDTLLMVVETNGYLSITRFIEMNYKTYRVEVEYWKATNTILNIKANRLICLGNNQKIVPLEKFLKKLKNENLANFDIYFLQLSLDDPNLYIVVYYPGSNFNPTINSDILNLRAQVTKKYKIR